MYLKNIEINGFKSFANKIIFEFPHGITGIVGPNGSGKSNIGDAVRWVLGEQSAKQLRGSRMEDVIFSGTESRKPLGFAYVAITFENSDRKIPLDYDEIKVARRVYRSGESEYLLNGSVCRRRQIVELFYDTGIGKEGYSIIGQGQVEKILSGRLEDSRELFDEAAGIAKYKKDRSVTEKALEKSQADLMRVSDILNVLETQVGPLEEQSKKAKQYLKLRDREKEIDIQLFIRDYSNASQEKEQSESGLAIVKDQLIETREEYESRKEINSSILAKAQAYEKQTEEQEQEMAGLREEKSVIDRSIVELQHEVDKNLLMEEQYRLNIQQSEEEIKTRQQEMAEQENQIQLEEASLEDCENALRILEIDRQKVSDQLTALEEARSEEQENMLTHLSDTSDLKEKITRVETLEEQLTIRNAEYNSRYLMLQSEIASYHEGASSLKEEITSVEKEKEKWQTAYEEETKSHARIQSSLDECRKNLDQQNQLYHRNRSQYETLSNLTERYEGYQKSIKHVMEQKKNNPDIIGVVADILTMDQEYELAIEIALGGALQNIVTEDEAVAKKMIYYHKRNRLGRATFLPLTSIRKRNIAINPNILEEDGVIGIASDLVSAEDRFGNLIASLLGRTIVAKNVDCALYLAKKYNFSLRIVTLDGELLNPGGSITGGAYRNNSNLLGRHREIEESKENMQKAWNACEQLKKDMASLNDESLEVAENLRRKKEKLDESIYHLTELSNQLPQMEEKEEELKKRLDDLKEEHEIIKEQISEIAVQKKSLSRHQRSHEKISEENQDTMVDIDQQIQELSARSDLLQEQYNELILKQGQTKQRIEFIHLTIQRLTEEIQSFQDGILEAKEEQNRLLLENRHHNEELSGKKRLLHEAEEKIYLLDTAMEKVRESRRNITEELNVSYKELEEAGEKLRLLEKEESRLGSSLEKMTHELETLADYMWENYELTYNNTLALKNEELSNKELGQWRKEKKGIRQKIKALGNVNVGAIEEYKEVGERYAFLREQYDDIKETEEKLLALIDEFNIKMKTQFEEKFQDIKDMFRRVFQDLFQGGTASLELVDQDDILGSGIRIIAQPPGKKLQNILLLSGGERALTAIALLFAIQNLKPSPFCLLDEIEAALDDTNIVRFSRYLRSLSDDTQFIVITHRRGTMNAADVLYGITMQEKGISTLISVDLIDKELKE